ncbi:AMP-dependent synthetase [Pseudomonas sp. MYb2]|jgi:phenylacetate-CoA ligase|uniref:phenylacetate--CoA ligase family protein n=1 Tax=Pseudomonas TaxID=286 RepID=UPI000D00137A|nr:MULTISPECIES: AMP-binding protein [Pseudomonas]MCP1488523.1 phenylacetate-CoA ligase [Pseudomonas fluorescens]PRB47091.1 AMP-dependent synthetase [Pseudomonas sp. MYb3]PRC32419.1 AMP-dependent synthetase [Pseudomonas sp. MYb2]
MTAAIKLNQLVGFARAHSNYYREHLHNVPSCLTSLCELPLIDPHTYWQSSHDLDQWPVLTGNFAKALVFKTGGTTSNGKLSVFTRDEWQTLVSDFGVQLTAQLNDGDRIANLFFVGDLYASFVFVHDTLAHTGSAVTEFPFTGSVDSAVLADSIAQYRINVLAGVPAHLLTFAAWLERQSRTLEGIDTLLYGGESLFGGQLLLLRRVFPNARIASIGYASVDAGFIGFSSRDCALDEHRMLERHSVVEILDEQTGEVIEDCGRKGRLVLTNFTRRLMPLIRYPVGDLACWKEPRGTPMRKFALMGRSMDSQRVRVGSMTLLTAEIGEIVQRIAAGGEWQLVLDHSNDRDDLHLKWRHAALHLDTAQVNADLRTALIDRYPLIEQLTVDGLLDLQVVSCAGEDFACHPRSGKHQKVVDLRIYGNAYPEPHAWTP